MTTITQVLVFDEHELPAAARFAAAMNAPVTQIERHRFPDGEVRLRLPTGLSGCVAMWRSLDRPNDKLAELLIAAPAARELGAAEVWLVCPYLAYMRQDKAFAPGEAVSQRHVGRFLAGLFEVLATVDPHLHRISSLGKVMPGCRCVVVSAAEMLGALVAPSVARPLLIGPDEESAPWVRRVALAGGESLRERSPLDHAWCAKQRHGDREVSVELPAGLVVAGRAVVLVDDVASTGRTLVVTARRCLELGAASVDVAVTHALLGDADLLVLRQAGVREVWSTDSVPHPTNAVSIVPALVEALRVGRR